MAHPRSKARQTLRIVLRRLHLVLALTAGLVLALVGGSGALLAFSKQMTHAQLAPEIADAPPPTGQADWAPFETWLAEMRAAYPELTRIEGFYAPGATPVAISQPVIAAEVDLPGGGHGHGVVVIDPQTGEPYGFFVAETLFAVQLLIFHAALWNGTGGDLIVAIAGVAFIASFISGAALWFPKPRRRLWARAIRFGPGGGRRRLLDLHNVPTIWLAIPLCIVMLSGLYLQRPDWVRPVLGLETSDDRLSGAGILSTDAGACDVQTSLDQAVALARAAHDGAAIVRYVQPPHAPGDPIVVSLTTPGADIRVDGSTFWVDATCPAILHQVLAAERSNAGAAAAWAWPLHADLGLGAAGRIVIFGAGACLPVLFVTGLILWWRRKRGGGSRRDPAHR